MLYEIISRAGDYFRQGGWIMFPIALVSLAMWALIIDRLRALGRMASTDIPISEAIRIVREGSAESCRGEGLRACLVKRFNAQRSGDPSLDREILGQCALQTRLGLDRYLPTIAVLAGIAPLLGLLGTVLGMIQTFDVISLFGTGNAKAMAGGISVALITTQTGLLVAIPGLFLTGVLTRRARQLRTRLDEITTVLSRVVKSVDAVVDPAEEATQAGELQAV